MTKNIRLLYIHNFLIDFRFQEAFLVIYFAQVAGSYTMAMSVLATATIAKALTDIPTGIFSDRIGRKYTIAAGSVCTTIAVTCYAFAANASGLFIGALFAGLGQSLFSGNNNALLYETLKSLGHEDRYHYIQSRASSMFQLALGLSALAATFIAQEGLRTLFILGIIPQFVGIIVSLFFKEPRLHTASPDKSLNHLKVAFLQIARNPRLRLLTIGQSISWGCGEAQYNFVTAFVNTLWPTWAVALYRMGQHGLCFVGFWFTGHLLDRIKRGYVFVLPSAYGFTAGIVATVMANVVSPILFMSGSLFMGPYVIASEQIMQRTFSDEQRATCGSVVSFTGSLFYAVSALLLGVISDRFGLMPAMIVGLFACVTALPIYVTLFRKHF